MSFLRSQVSLKPQQVTVCVGDKSTITATQRDLPFWFETKKDALNTLNAKDYWDMQDFQSINQSINLSWQIHCGEDHWMLNLLSEWQRSESLCLRSQRRHCVPDQAPPSPSPSPGRKLQSSTPLLLLFLLFLRREDSGWTLRVQRRGSEMKAVPTSCVHVKCLIRAPALPCPAPRLLPLPKNWNCWGIFCFVFRVLHSEKHLLGRFLKGSTACITKSKQTL